MESLFKYKGMDWLAMISTVLSIYYLGRRMKRGFPFGVVGNVAWMIFGFMTASVANVIADLIYIGMNIHAWRKWQMSPVPCPTPK